MHLTSCILYRRELDAVPFLAIYGSRLLSSLEQRRARCVCVCVCVCACVCVVCDSTPFFPQVKRLAISVVLSLSEISSGALPGAGPQTFSVANPSC